MISIFRIKSFFKYYCYYNIKNGLYNFWRYRKIIWNDRNWDFMYLNQLVLFKLKLMLHHMENHALEYEGIEECKNSIRQTIEKIEAYEEYEEKGIPYKDIKELENNDMMMAKVLEDAYLIIGRECRKWWD